MESRRLGIMMADGFSKKYLVQTRYTKWELVFIVPAILLQHPSSHFMKNVTRDVEIKRGSSALQKTLFANI